LGINKRIRHRKQRTTCITFSRRHCQQRRLPSNVPTTKRKRMQTTKHFSIYCKMPSNVLKQ